MLGIRILGSGGSVGKEQFTTCLQITRNTLIDAGNIMQALGDDAFNINNIFLTHSHLDHIVDSAYLMDNTFGKRKEPIKIYGLPKTLKAIKEYIFNWHIWPDFSKMRLPSSGKFAVEYIEIEYGKEYPIENNITLIPIVAHHTIECCGYIIKSNKGSILFTSDTYTNPSTWKNINENRDIKSIIIDVSFPDRMAEVAAASKHLTPMILKKELQNLKRDDVNIYINHTKPFVLEDVEADLKKLGREYTVLKDGYLVQFNGKYMPVSNENEKIKIEKLNKIGIALSSQRDINKVLEIIVQEAKSLTNADGGTLYLRDGDELRFTVVQTDSLDIKMGGTSGKIEWGPLPLYIDGKPNKKMVAVTCVLEDRIINIPDVYNVDNFNFDGTKAFDKNTGYRSKSMLVIPLRNHENKVIGALQLINRMDILKDEITSFGKEDEEITLSLASQAAITMTNNILIRDLEKLLEAFLNSIIVAISKKSKHTAGHIKRMAKLSNDFALAINKDNKNFKDKHYNSEELKQIRLAALMHDIGKLSIPEYVVDKAKKLEGMFDGIYTIQFRIELIKKDLQIAALKGEISQEEAIKEQDKLDEYFSIIYKSNEGAEFTPKENVELFEELTKKIYRINGNIYKVLSKDECEKLSVQRGTLTAKERDIINSHAKITLDILSELPFPQKYHRIPEIASNHHEKINGKGYPRGLKGDEISFEARILAIADVFEALTASDRPYKKANPLSKAMQILYFMAKDGDLDKELVKYFYNSGLYLKYAKKFLPPRLVDKVNVDFDSL